MIHLRDASITSTGAVVGVGDLPVVLGDRAQLVQLLLNLVGNGLNYCRDRAPLVHLSAVQREGVWVFFVTHNGIGIDAQHHEKVFEIFKRLHFAKRVSRHRPGDLSPCGRGPWRENLGHFPARVKQRLQLYTIR